MAALARTSKGSAQGEPGFILQTPRAVKVQSSTLEDRHEVLSSSFPTSGVKCALVLKPLEAGQVPTVSCGETWLKLSSKLAHEGTVTEVTLATFIL